MSRTAFLALSLAFAASLALVRPAVAGEEAEPAQVEWLVRMGDTIITSYIAQQIDGAIQAYHKKTGKLPASLNDLMVVPEDAEEPYLKEIIPPRLGRWHKAVKKNTTKTYPRFSKTTSQYGADRDNVGLEEKEGRWIFTGIAKDVMKDTGGWGYVQGKKGAGPLGWGNNDFYLIFASCTHPCMIVDGQTYTCRQALSTGGILLKGEWVRIGGTAEYEVAMNKAFEAAMGNPDEVKYLEADPIGQALMERSREAATRGNLNALKGAISIYYGDNEGVNPGSLSVKPDSPFSQYLEKVPPVKATHVGIGNGIADSPEGDSVFVTKDEIIDKPGKGWRYSPVTGHVFVNSCSTDSTGVPYSTYGY
jgi:hypothetical protein